MQLFTRQVTTAPAGPATEWAVEIRAAASAAFGTEVSLWAASFGAPVGTLAFTARVEGIADLTTRAAPMLEDAGYAALLAKGQEFMVAPPEDSLATPLMGELGDPPPVGSMAVVTNAVIANGKFADAVAWGMDIAAHAAAVGGMPVGLMMQEYGTFGQLTWIGGAPDAAAVDASMAATAADADYVGKLGAAGDLFVPGSGNRVLASRIA